MNCSYRRLLQGLFLSPLLASSVLAASSGNTNRAVVTLDTPRTFPEIKSLAQWQERAREIREQVLISSGLWPLPKKTPLGAHVFDKVERDGYSIEKVYFQTYPGFYLAGNLYRPLGHGRGPFPGVLNPHGHWANGRMADTKDGSIAARCISFARQGMVAFSYDMVGYNDSHFPSSATNRILYETHRTFGTNRPDQLWNISLMGLQTWNSIRALDFLASLPDVDKKRLACTGESGGGTQTYMLGAIVDRLALQAPIVMVSHTMQGGCSCENAPGLRVEYSNMEIAAAAAPRVQMLVAATGDWTKTTMEVEGPALGKIYELYGAPERLRYVRFDFGHNYNQTSREAVYGWFDHWLLKQPDAASVKELLYKKEPDADLRVFPDKLPADAVTKDELIESLKQMHRKQWDALVPKSRRSFAVFKREVLPAWRHTLQVEWPADATSYSNEDLRAILNDGGKTGETVVIMAGTGADDDRFLAKVAEGLHGHNLTVVTTRSSMSQDVQRDEFANFFTCYNRTYLQEQTRRLVMACVAARDLWHAKRVILCGHGRAGLWALLAAPAADAVIADCAALDVANDETLLQTGLFCPGLRNIGTFEGAAMLSAPHPLLLHNTGENFPTAGIHSAYKALGARKSLKIESGPMTEEAVVKWVSQL